MRIREKVSASTLAEMMLSLQAKGCHNINLVSRAMCASGAGRWSLPEKIWAALCHTGGYDAVPTLKLLDGIVDIYMPDFKSQMPALQSGIRVLQGIQVWRVPQCGDAGRLETW